MSFIGRSLSRVGRFFGIGYSTPISEVMPKDTGESWNPGNRSIDGDMIPARPYIEARIKNLIQTDGFLSGALDTHCNHTVGNGLMLSSIPDWEKLEISEDEAVALSDELEREFAYYVNSSAHWADAGRRFNWAALNAQAYKSFIVHGEILTVPKFSRNQLWNSSVMIIDPNRLADPRSANLEDNIRGGVKINENGAPVEYYIYKENPLERVRYRTVDDDYTVVTPTGRTGRKRIGHYFDPVGPEQTRGISLFAPVVDAVKRQHDLSDATLKAAVYQTLIAAVIKSDLPYEAAMSLVGAGTKGAGNWMDFAKEYQDQHLDYYKEMRIKMDGMKTIHLLPHEDLELRAAGALNSDYAEFAATMNREAARGVQLPNETYTGDYAALSYSGGQLSSGENERGHIARRTRVMVPFAQDIYELFCEEYFIKNPDRLPRHVDFWTYKDAICRANWIGPPPIFGDPVKTATAAQLRIMNRISTREYEMAQHGIEWRSGMRQMKREEDFMDELEIFNPQVKEQILVQENAQAGDMEVEKLKQQAKPKQKPAPKSGAKK